MFRGVSFHTIDQKGRVIIPARFRDLIKSGGGDGVMLATMDKCLFGYTYDYWNIIEQNVLSISNKDESYRRLRRVFIGGAFDCSFDKQYRVLIPPSLRDYAELEKEIVLVGVLKSFEVWSREKWDLENEKMKDDLVDEDVLKEISKLGL